MSEPIRYNVKCGDDGYQIAESLGGEWVRYGDYARLQAEVERLQKLVGMQKSIDESIDAWIESKRTAAKEGNPSK